MPTPERDLSVPFKAAPITMKAPAATMGGSAIHERIGPYEIRLLSGAKALRRVQRLRYAIFYEEGEAFADPAVARMRRDLCPFDAICDHLVVIDTEARTSSGECRPRIVGTYRLLRREVADRHNGFYSRSEFDLAPLLDRHPSTRFLELGRSCVHAQYRSKRVIELLWRGLWLYVKHYEMDALIGCASLPGVDLDALRLPLSFLLRNAQADKTWQVAALPHCAVEFEPLARSDIDVRRGFLALPPLVKAYLRTGARFSQSAVIDRQFNTTDLFAVLPVAEIEERYIEHYGEASCVSAVPVA